ncbi:MAG: aspartate/glutamate racemase family protein [Alphaproteobacteria bacterium]|nr:aspartate/glutamate racemase family protein [Alphaproteobacteria bacterium]
MIGVFDSGLGGLTVLRALAERFPDTGFTYYGDHANVPYGDRASDEVVDLTRAGVEALFSRGCHLVLLGCNTATAVAARRLQQSWLPNSQWRSDHNILGIVAPTVEAATQTPWAVTTPQDPQKHNTDRIAVFGTTRTIQSDVYVEEIRKRCPRVRLTQQICAGLAGAIEAADDEAKLEQLIKSAVANLLQKTEGEAPDQVILGCTHFPLVEHLFRRYLPTTVDILSQPELVAESLADYLARHPNYACQRQTMGLHMLTTGDPVLINRRSRVFWSDVPPFDSANQTPHI